MELGTGNASNVSSLPGQGGCLHPCLGDVDAVVTPVMFFVTFSTNLCTLVLMSRAMNVKSRITNIPVLLVLALCTADLMIAVLGDSLWLLSRIAGAWIGGAQSCRYSAFVVLALTTLSQSLVVLMGIERFLAIRRPFYYEKHVTPQRTLTAILVLVVFSFVNATLMLFSVWDSLVVYGDRTRLFCTVDTSAADAFVKSFVYWTFTKECLLVSVLIFCNIAVLGSMKKMRKRMAVMCPRNKDEYLKQVDMLNGIHAEFSRLMVAITVVFLITITPLQIRRICNQFHVWPSPLADYIAHKLSLSNSMINPFIYGLTRRHFRKQAGRCLLKTVTCCRSNRVQHIPNLSETKDREMQTYNNTDCR